MSEIVLKCSKCKEHKPETDFGVSNSRKCAIKRNSACKACYKSWRDKNKAAISVRAANTYQKNKEKITARRIAMADELKAKRVANKEKIAKRSKEYREQNKEMLAARARTAKGRFTYSRPTARSRGHAWDLTLEQYSALISKPCEYCRKITLGFEMGIGLDRIDCNKGYTADNVNPSCGDCNYLIGDFTKAELITRLPVLLEALIRLGYGNDCTKSDAA